MRNSPCPPPPRLVEITVMKSAEDASVSMSLSSDVSDSSLVSAKEPNKRLWALVPQWQAWRQTGSTHDECQAISRPTHAGQASGNASHSYGLFLLSPQTNLRLFPR